MPEALASENSPRSSGSQPTAASRASGTTTTGVGSTPTVPAPLRSPRPRLPPPRRPVEIAAAPVSAEGLAALRAREPAVTVMIKPDEGERPSYASLITPENMTKEERCLAEAVYFEVRSEPRTGRRRSPRWC